MKKKENQSVEKVCSFYVNDWHLTTMMLPYMNRRIRENTKIITILQNGMNDKVKELIGKMNLSKESTSQLLNIDWTSNTIFKYTDMKELIEEPIKEENIDILVNGTLDYMDIVNKNIDKILAQGKVKATQITIINCYEVGQFEDINPLLQKHSKLLNTSGLRNIEEVFEGYEKQDKKNLAN